MTSWPAAFSITRSVKSLTTLKLTSASRRAVRTSRMASRTFSSEMRPRPARPRKTPLNLSVRAVNIVRNYYGVGGVCHRGRLRGRFISVTPEEIPNFIDLPGPRQIRIAQNGHSALLVAFGIFLRLYPYRDLSVLCVSAVAQAGL